LRLGWSHLLIDRVDEGDFRRWISPWAGSVTGELGLAFLNMFGVWFLRRPAGPVEMLDVFSGKLEPLADTYEAFLQEVNDRSWQEMYLLSEVVFHLHDTGRIPGPGECYGLHPHPGPGGPNPMRGDPLDPDRIVILPVGEWQSRCAEALSRHV
jgi:hypothetical protein